MREVAGRTPTGVPCEDAGTERCEGEMYEKRAVETLREWYEIWHVCINYDRAYF